MYEADWTKRIWRLFDSVHGDVKTGIERRLWDGTRVDVLTKLFACEVDWAPKWAEAIGQSLWYANVVGRDPIVILLVKDFDRERRYIYRAQVVCTEQEIGLWMVDTKKSEIIMEGHRIAI